MFLEMCFLPEAERASSHFDNCINSLTWHKFEPGKSKNGIALKQAIVTSFKKAAKMTYLFATLLT